MNYENLLIWFLIIFFLIFGILTIALVYGYITEYNRVKTLCENNNGHLNGLEPFNFCVINGVDTKIKELEN